MTQLSLQELRKKISAIDQHIRQADGATARNEILALYQTKIPREVAAEFAWISWRAILPLLGIRVLNPIVRPSVRKPTYPTDSEKAEYANCLTKIGATEEALELLKNIDTDKYPIALLYKASANITQWNYEPSIHLLRKYLSYPNIDPYQRLVANVNLAAGLVFVHRHTEATHLLNELLEETRSKNLNLLHGNVLELSAENFILQKRWNEAEAILKIASSKLSGTESIYEFLVNKWKAIVRFSQEPTNPEALHNLDLIRIEAASRQHWGTIRECDRFQAIATKDSDLFLYLYFGTPFDSFRLQILHDFGPELKIPQDYVWHPIPSARPISELNLISGFFGRSKAKLKVGQAPYRLACALASDYYRPFRLATLYTLIFPGEYFNPTSSPPRVHQALKLLRQWFVRYKIPLTIEEAEGLYRLRASGHFAIRVPITSHREAPKRMVLEQVQRQWPSGFFTATQVAKELAISSRSARRMLSDAVDAGHLHRRGTHRGTQYSFHQPPAVRRKSA